MTRGRSVSDLEIERIPEIATATEAMGRDLDEIWETAPGLRGLLSTVDHKEIGKRYIVTAFIFLIAGGVEALVMRLQLATPNERLLTPEQYDQLFSTHGMTMIFLYALPVLSGFSNYLWPLVFGARDMAFPRMNALSYWIYVASGIFMYVGFAIGAGPNDGWFNYVPYANRTYNPGHEHGFLFARDDLSRHLDDGRGGQFHRHAAAHARAGHVDQPPADPGLGHAHRLGREHPGGARGQPGVLPAVDGPAVRHAFLRRVAGRAAAALAAPVLDVRPSLGVRDRAAGDGDGLRRAAGVLPPPAGRLYAGRALDGRHDDPRLRRLGAPHVRDRPAESRLVVLQRRIDHHHRAERGRGVRLDRRRSGWAGRSSPPRSCSSPA